MLPMEKEKHVQKSIFQMVCLILAQFFYLLCGSTIFMFLERENSIKSYQKALDDLIRIKKDINLTAHQEQVLSEAFGRGISFHDTELHARGQFAWDFISTLYFSITSTTTIGYGHHSPNTVYGQWFCIVFSLFGIPLHMVTLGTVGRHLNTVISRFLMWVNGKWVGKSQARRDLGTFIITAGLLVLFTVFSAGSTRMMIDDISYTEAVYFIYVTISTIGFGDFVIRFENQTKLNRVLILCLWVIAVYVGMAILSATVMSLSTRAKQFYKLGFGWWDRKVLGKTFKRAKRRKGHADSLDVEGLILVDKQFLIAQLDMQTDPSKRAEIQKWIDMCIENSLYSSQYDTTDDEFDYSERNNRLND